MKGRQFLLWPRSAFVPELSPADTENAARNLLGLHRVTSGSLGTILCPPFGISALQMGQHKNSFRFQEQIWVIRG